MALAITLDDPRVPIKSDLLPGGPPGCAIRTGRLAFDASYPNTGGTVGEPLTEAALGFSVIHIMLFPAYKGYFFEYDAADNVVHAYYGDTNAVADGAFIEIPNATSLATLTAVPFLAIGIPA